MKNKKIISLLLAFMMMLSVVPMYASAAEPEVLTKSNITQYPTISFKNADGKFYAGQMVGDGLIINDDEIVTDASGNQVAGHFEFIDLTATNTLSGSGRADIKFVPDDATSYTGFDFPRCRYVTYPITITTPVFIDENDTIPVATEVEPGATLSTSTLSGAKVKNPYNEAEPKALASVWQWRDGSIVVNESGYYEAYLFISSGYEDLSAQVYVKIASNIPETTISEMPVIEPLVYDASMTLKDVVIKGGVAVLKNEGTVVDGTFSIAESAKDYSLSVGNYNVPVTFTPADPEAALPYTFDIPITVTKAPIKFVDENGNEIIPEITVPYGTKLTDGNMRYYISQAGCTAVAGKDGCYYGATDADGYIFGTSASGEAPEVGTHYYEFIARPYTTVGVTSYYEDTVLKLKVTVTPVEAEMKLDTSAIKGTDGLELWVWNKDTSSAARPEGTFTVYLDGAVYKDNVKYGEHFTWQPAESKTYEFKATYTPTENDPFTIADFTMSRDIKLTRKLTASENILKGYGDFKYGATVEISANLTAENFAGWKVTDAKGNEVTLDGVDNSKTKITITMPDYDIHVEALEKNASSGGSGGLGDIDFGDLSEGDSEWAIINIIRNIIAMFKSFLQQLIETFQSIGD